MTEKLLEFTIGPDDSGTRLDRCLSRLIPDCSRSFLQELIKNSQVKCNGEVVTVPRYPVRENMKISVVIPESDGDFTLSESNFDFPVIYEDESLLVINKPAGVVVHPGAGNPDGTVVNALLSRYPGFAERFGEVNLRPGIVHRLDKDTSGCLVIAKTPEAQFKLGMSFARRETAKTYLALLKNIPAQTRGEISNLIGRHPVNRQKMAVVERNGKTAVSRYRIVRQGKIGQQPCALAEVDILTGRTHQIRVHMSSVLNCPVAGDELYGGKFSNDLPRQLLHAWKLQLPHPLTGELLKLTAPIPDDLEKFIGELEA